MRNYLAYKIETMKKNWRPLIYLLVNLAVLIGAIIYFKTKS